MTEPAPHRAAAPITPAAWYALTLVSLVQMVSLLDRNILAILAPRIKADLKIGDAEMGLLYGTVFALFYALFSLPLGRLADGWVRTKLLAICLSFWSLATGLAGFAQGFTLLMLSRLGVGIGEAATQPAGTSLVFDYFPRERRGFAMAVMASAIALGLGGSSVLGGVAADWWDGLYAASANIGPNAAPLALKGWQFAFIIAALPGLVLAVLVWRMREPVRGSIDGIPTPVDPAPFAASLGVLGSVTPGANWIALARRGASARDWLTNGVALAIIAGVATALTLATSAFSPRPPLVLAGLSINPHALQWGVIGFGAFVIFNLLQSLRFSDPPAHALFTRSPSLMLCIAVGSLQGVINYGVMGFTPSFLMKQFHQSPTETGLQFGILSAVIGVVGPMIAGPLSDKFSARMAGGGRVVVTLFALAVSPLVALWVYTAGDAMGFYGRFILYSLILTAWMPPLYAVLYSQVLPRMRGITTGLYLMASTICGLGMGPYIVGMVSDAYGGNLGRAILSVNCVAPVIVVMLVVLLLRAGRDEALVVERARAAGEPV